MRTLSQVHHMRDSAGILNPDSPPNMRFGMHLVVTLGLLLLLPFTAQAAPSIKVSVDQTEVQIGQPITVEVTLVSAGAGFGGPEIQQPRLDGFVQQGRVAFSRYDSRSAQNVKTLQLTLRPVRTGSLTIGAFQSPQPNGVPLKTEPIRVLVTGAAPPTANPANPGDPNGNTVPPAPESEADQLAFLRWEIGDTSLWLGEQQRIQLVLYVNRDLSVRDFSASDINPQGFWKVERDQRSRARLVQFGQQLYAAETIYDQQIFPLRAGKLELPAVDATMTVTTRSFGRRRQQRITRRAEPIALTVKKLPTTGRPANFAGPTVGRVRIEAHANRTQVKAEDGLQLTITTRIDGLIENVPEVQLPSVPGLRIFPPTSTTNSALRGDKITGVRRQTWLIKPTTTGHITIPAVSLPWFSPKRGRYQVARTRPLHLSITGTPKADPKHSDAAAPKTSDAPKLRSIRAEVDLSDATSGPLYGSTVFYLLVTLPPLAFFGLLLAGRVRTRRNATAGSRAARGAAKVATSALQAAKRERPSEAYTAIAHALESYLSTRFTRPFKGLTHEQLRQTLTGFKVPPKIADELIKELENCDFARFAPGTSAGDVATAADRASALVSAIEEAV